MNANLSRRNFFDRQCCIYQPETALPLATGSADMEPAWPGNKPTKKEKL
ncbi:MAG: hypothetical protein P4N60_24275 [Verrucomicrobiae bacterium]|nr:hypothetical protein [Verrucomicrobiae bacterium]